MALFSRKKKKEDRVLVLDIGSASVGAALVESVYENEFGHIIPKILFSTRTEIELTNQTNFTHYVNAMLFAYEDVLKKVYDARFAPPDRIVGVLAAPWYASHTRTITHSKKTPFLFTKKLWYELLMAEANIFSQQAQETFGEFDGGMRLLERTTMSVRLNGYSVEHPFQKKTKEVALDTYFSMSPEYLLHALEEILDKYFTRPLLWSTYLFASFAVARDIFVNENQYLLLDIGGEVTDIGLVKDGVLVESLSFPHGKRVLLRAVMEHLAVSSEEALSMLALYNEGLLSERHRQALLVVLHRVMNEWTKLFERSLEMLTHDFVVPETIFITVDEGVRSLYEYAVHKEGYLQFTHNSRRFNVIVVDASALHEYCTLHLLAERDQFLMIDALFATRHKKLN